jgi:hypothetical protein
MSALTEALNSYMSGNFIDGRTSAYIATSTNIASAIAVGIGGLVLSWDYLKNSLTSFDDGREGKLFDPFVLGKIIFFIFILQMYPYTIKPVLNYFNEINQSYAQSEASYDSFNQKLEQELLIKEKSKSQILDESQNDPNLNPEEKELIASENEALSNAGESSEEKGLWRSMKDGIGLVAQLIEDPRVFTAQVFHWIANILIFIIRPVVKVFAFYSIKLLTVLGPFAIAFSLLPGFSGQLPKWFGRLGNLLFASIMFTILDSLFMDTFAEIALGVTYNDNINGLSMGDSERWTYMFNVIAFDLAVVALYLSPFFLASAILGSGDGGSMVSKTIGIGSAAFGMMATAATGGASLATSVATGVPTNLGGGSSSSKNPLKDIS